jgi:hypothetical protein
MMRTSWAFAAVLIGYSLAEQLEEQQVAKVRRLLSNSFGSCSRGCTTIDKLHWWGASIGNAGCEELSTQLVSASKPYDGKPARMVKNLLLGGNMVGDACMGALARAAAKGALKVRRPHADQRIALAWRLAYVMLELAARTAHMHTHPTLLDRCRTSAHSGSPATASATLVSRHWRRRLPLTSCTRATSTSREIVMAAEQPGE